MTTAEETKQLAPWTDSVPSDWHVTRLDAAADVLFSNVDKHTIDDEIPVRLCNYVDVYKNERITSGLDYMEASADAREIRKFQIRRGDILATKDSEEWDDIAIPSLVAEDLPGVLCGYHLAMIRPRLASVSGSYLAWLHISKSFRAQYEAKAVGVTRFGLSQYAFRAARIPLPPFPEQQRIAAYLDASCAAIDAAVAAKRRQLETLDTLCSSILLHALTIGLHQKVETRPTGATVLPQIPVGWRFGRLKSVASIRYGLGQPPAELESGVAMIRATDVDGGIIRTDKLLRVDPEELPPDRNPYLKAGEIIVVRSGAYTGDSAIVPPELEGTVAGYDMVVTVTRASSRFIAYCLLSRYVLEGQILLLTLRAAQPHLNAEELGSVLLALPPTRKEQEAIADFLDTRLTEVQRIVTGIETQIATLTDYRKSLIHECVTGQRRITEEEKRAIQERIANIDATTTTNPAHA